MDQMTQILLAFIIFMGCVVHATFKYTFKKVPNDPRDLTKREYAKRR